MKKLSLDELLRPSVSDFKTFEKTPITIVLDNVRSALNVGSIFRTADSFAIERICICGITACPPNREILKTALGATDSVAWTHFDSVEAAIISLRDSNYRVFAVEQTDSSRFVQDFECFASDSIGLVFGNEVDGVSEEALVLCEGAIEIPQFGTKHSLNVSVAAGIVIWEVFRQLRL